MCNQMFPGVTLRVVVKVKVWGVMGSVQVQN